MEEAYKDIIKGKTDKRTYRYLELENKLRIILVHDEETVKSAASLAVYAGSCLDPEDRPGLAHFCEHMLFMGTKKFPVENDFDDFLSKNSGYSNAYTASNLTNYYFECSNESLSGALDRFSQFFISPLFSPSSTSREMKAVDSEHAKNKQNDDWRLYNLQRIHSNPLSSYCRFSTGNLDTLDHPSIRDDLLAYHAKYYSANIMSLAIYSKQELDVMQQFVGEYFRSVGDLSVEEPDYGKVMAYGGKYIGRIFRMCPVKNKRKLAVAWYLEYDPDFVFKPWQYVVELLGHEGPGSLLSALRKKGLVMELEAGVEKARNGFIEVYVYMDLTDQGVEEYENILGMLYAYIEVLKKEGVQKWLAEEQMKMSDINFQYKNKEDYSRFVFSLSERLFKYPYEHIVDGPHVISGFDEDRINKIIDVFTPELCDIFLISRKNESQADQVAKYYGTKYSMERIPESLLAALKNPSVFPELSLPPKNKFIPENLALLGRHDSMPDEPILIKSFEKCELWWKQDNKFERPSGIISIKMMTKDSEFSESIRGKLFIELYERLLNEYLSEYMYMAKLAAINMNFDLNRTDSLQIKIEGFSESLYNFSTSIFKMIKECDFAKLKPQFLNYSDKYLKELEDLLLSTPYQLTRNLFSSFMQQNCFSVHQLIAELKQFTFEKFVAMSKEWFLHCNFTILMHGNVSQEESIKTIGDCMDVLNVDKIGRESIGEQRIVSIPNKTGYYYIEKAEDRDEENSCIVSYFQNDVKTLRTEALNALLVQYLSESTFNQLRTVEQLGK